MHKVEDVGGTLTTGITFFFFFSFLTPNVAKSRNIDLNQLEIEP